MSFVSAIVLAAQANIALTLPPSRTVEEETLPSSTYDCRLTSENGATVSFMIEIQGWRAFQTEGGIKHTNSTMRVLSDPGMVLQDYHLDTFDGQAFSGISPSGKGVFGEWFQARIRQASETLTKDFKGRVMMTIGEFRLPNRGIDPYFTHVGFCDAVRTPQSKLSNAEAAEFEK